MAINDKKDGGLIESNLSNPRSTFNVYVAPATTGVETIWDAVALAARRTIGSGVVALIIGSRLERVVVCGTPV